MKSKIFKMYFVCYVLHLYLNNKITQKEINLQEFEMLKLEECKIILTEFFVKK